MENQICPRCKEKITKGNELVKVYVVTDLTHIFEMCGRCRENLLAYLDIKFEEEADMALLSTKNTE